MDNWLILPMVDFPIPVFINNGLFISKSTFAIIGIKSFRVSKNCKAPKPENVPVPEFLVIVSR